MTTRRKATTPTTAAVDQFAAQFDDLFGRRSARQALRQYLIGLLLPRERNKALTVLASLVPDADRPALHHFLPASPWDAAALNERRLALWQRRTDLAPHSRGVLIVDETGDRKRGRGIVLAAQQDSGKLGKTANGVVAVTSHWADGQRHAPLGARADRPAARLPQGQADPQFQTKPELAGELIEEARAQGIPFRVVVADGVYGENATLEGRLFGAKIGDVLALRPNTGTWPFGADEADPPAFTPAEAARRAPREAWQRLVRRDRHGKAVVRFVAELERGVADGPTRPVRLIAATDDPDQLKPDCTGSMATTLPRGEAAPAAVDALSCWRDWIEHDDTPAQHALGWADDQVRSAEAIERHWHLVLLAYTFRLLAGTAPTIESEANASVEPAGGKTPSGADRLERGAASRASLALSRGPTHPLLETVVAGPSARRVGRSP
jgi:hypothetical protein